MRAFAPSAVTASEATTTMVPVTWAVVWVAEVNQKIAIAISNSFYVVLCLIVHIPNFIQIGKKNIEVIKIGYPSALVGWSGQIKNSCIHF